MEVLAKDRGASPFLLTNAEVLDILRSRIQHRKGKEKRQKHDSSKTKYKHRDWIEESVLEYLEKTPCANLNASTREELRNMLTSTKRKSFSKSKKIKTTGFGLTEAESLQILNFAPQEKVEIHLMVEELHARMTDKRQDELLDLIQSHVVYKKKETSNKERENDGDVTMEDNTQEPAMCAIKEEI